MTTQAIDQGAIGAPAIPASKARLWAGRVMTAIPVLFLLMDGGMKLFPIAPVTETMTQLGWQPSLAPKIGILLLASLALYVLPRTSVLGAILLTGYLGGAIATHVRVGNPLFTYVLFPVYVALLLWGGLYLREDRLRALIPLRSDR
jgi:hypothetical protein